LGIVGARVVLATWILMTEMSDQWMDSSLYSSAFSVCRLQIVF